MTLIREDRVSYESNGARISAYVAWPSERAAVPGIVLLHGNPGLEPYALGLAQRLANAGYAAIAPNLYSRVGGIAPAGSDRVERARAIDRALPNDQVLADAIAARDILLDLDQVKGQAVGLYGYCMGGRQGIYIACNTDVFACLLCFYGGVRMPARTTHDAKPRSYLSYIRDLSCPIQYHVGDHDPICPIPDVEELRAELVRHGKDHEIYIYEDTGHGFHNESGAEYAQHAAETAWQRGLEFLTRSLDRPQVR